MQECQSCLTFIVIDTVIDDGQISLDLPHEGSIVGKGNRSSAKTTQTGLRPRTGNGTAAEKTDARDLFAGEGGVASMSGYQSLNPVPRIENAGLASARAPRAEACQLARGRDDGRQESLAAAIRREVLPQLVRRNAVPVPRDGATLRQHHHVEKFTRLLLDEGGHGCDAYLDAFLGRNDDPQAAAAYLLAPAARLLGDFWRMDVCDFMAVTVAMTRIQRMFWRMATEHPPAGPARSGRNALLAPVPGEQHSFGLAVVEDALRRAGWHVDCCAGGSGEEMMGLAGRGDYALIGLSLSGDALAGSLAGVIRDLRRKNRHGGAHIIVGGGIFVDKPHLAFLAGADFLALDAQAAVGLAAGLAPGECGRRATMATG